MFGLGADVGELHVEIASEKNDSSFDPLSRSASLSRLESTGRRHLSSRQKKKAQLKLGRR